MTTIAILIILIVIQLLVSWLLLVREQATKPELSVKAERSWSCDWACYGSVMRTMTTSSSQVSGLRYGGSYDYSLSYCYRQPISGQPKRVVESPFHIEEIDEQEQHEKLRPSNKTLRYHNPKSFERKEKALRDLRRGQRAIKALMRA